MKKATVHFSLSPPESLVIGELAENRGRIFFEYEPEFLLTGLNLSPFLLPFETDLFEHKDLQFGPLPGLFDDSLPDGWGLLLMDRYFRSQNLNPAEISVLDRLLWLGTRTMGTLTYHPAVESEYSDLSGLNLHHLAQNSLDILSGKTRDVLPQLQRNGGSPGGARPKVLVGFNPLTDQIISDDTDLPEEYEPWMIKFPTTDHEYEGSVEYAYSLMAADAGISLPATQLFKTVEGDSFFGIKRFDREGNNRFHVHTFGNLIQSNFRIPSADYADYFTVTSLLTRNHQEVLQAFRRMLFNILAHNRDDHVKNFSFMLDAQTKEWSLSPAYDLLFTEGIRGEHSMTIAGEGRFPTWDQVKSLAHKASIAKGDITSIYDEVEAAVSHWPDKAQQASIPENIFDRITASFRDCAL
ncbi:MAG: type II toxin-antitoxin system HipA family toxin [Bacteroidetes bacterium]|nr:type II toxin-antitoxin system HipA family toxin [Bacteroidota bacterium]